MPRSWKGRAIPLLTLWATVACYRENLYLLDYKRGKGMEDVTVIQR
jgi:hypothetical protein